MTSVTQDAPTESVENAAAPISAPPRSDSAPLSASPVVRSAAAAGRTLSAKLGEHTDVVYVVLATIAFVVVAGLCGYALL